MRDSNTGVVSFARPDRAPLPGRGGLLSGWIAISIAIALSGIVAAGQARGAGVTPLALELLAAKASWVVRGRVESMEVSRGADGIMTTRVELPVTEVWKGTATNRIGVVLVGGILGNRRVSVAGQAEFRVGDDVVLFLTPNDRSEGVIVELGQGKFAVHQDASGDTWVSNGILGTALAGEVASKTSTGPVAGEAVKVVFPLQRPLRLSELKQRVLESSKP